MRKFFILLKKEIRELLTPQMVVPFLVIMVLFYFFGQFALKQSKKAQGPQPIAIMDLDQSALSENLVSVLSKSNFEVKTVAPEADITTEMKKQDVILGLVFPKGFEKSVQNFSPEKVQTYSLLNNFSVGASSKYANLDKAVAVINETVSAQYITSLVPTQNPSLLKNPVGVNTFTVVKGKTAQVSASAVLGYIATQSNVVPVVLFLIIVLASQMIATSIASEKENKTLETLLTAPLNRKVIVTAKMIGAGLVGLLLAAIYLVGFRSFINTATAGMNSADLTPALNQLGLSLSPSSYLLLGLVVFLGILVALAIAIILGAFAEDVKGVQGTITPLMVLMMIPYFAVLFLDFSTLPIFAKYVIYAIPFSHIFLAMPNLFLHNNPFVFYGALYELVVFVIFVWIAAWIFSTDKIVTMRLNFGKRKK